MEYPAHPQQLFPPPFRPSTDISSGGAVTGADNEWGSCCNGDDFRASMGLVFLVFVCTLAFVLAFAATVRFFLGRPRPPPPSSVVLEKQDREERGAAPAAASAVAYTPGMELAGAAAECAICLGEFAEGEGLRVLPACNHGFHERCIEAWLAFKLSCPTCRCSCQVTWASPPDKPQLTPSERV